MAFLPQSSQSKPPPASRLVSDAYDELDEVANKLGIELDINGNTFAVVNLNSWQIANVPNDFEGAIDYLINARRKKQVFAIVATEERKMGERTFKTSCIVTK